MNSTELIEAVRQEVFMGTAAQFPDFEDTRLLIELSDELRTTFSRAVTQARSGYWLKQAHTTVTAGRAKYPIPRRAVIGGLENLSIADSSGKFVKLDEVSETHSQFYELASGQLGEVKKYVVRSDQVVLLPTPSQAYTLRFSYYLRPSRLVLAGYGTIDSVDTTTRTIVVDPVNTSLATGNVVIDVAHTSGWAELSLVNAPAFLVVTAGTTGTFTVGGTDPLDEIVVGDGLFTADETLWPCLPEDFHRTLAKAAAVKVMSELHMLQKADATANQVNADIQRFSDLLTSRVKSEAKVLKAPRAVLQVGRGQRGFYGWRG